MALDKDTVRHVATLARIKVAEADLESLAGELDNVMRWIEQLNEVDVTGIPPMVSTAGTQKLTMREDVVTDGGDAERILANGPERTERFFVVPKVVE
jgi:aspartyl-tRNA(Asn)/glutamyl-tRNA(Gln) amidotransferase subunit C